MTPPLRETTPTRRGRLHFMRNPIRSYEWGSRSRIAQLQRRPVAEGPEAELWLGAHPAAPSVLSDGSGVERSLPDLIAADAEAALGRDCVARFGARLPYLMKVVAIERALSIQVHPSAEQAAAGFDAQGGQPGLFADPWAKPEMLYATGPVELLAGLRHPRRAGLLVDLLDSPRAVEIRRLLVTGAHDVPESATADAMVRLAQWPRADVRNLVIEIGEATRRSLADPRVERDPDALQSLLWVLKLTQQHPADPLVLAPLLLDLHALQAGDTAFLPAGMLHAYLSGFAVEIMGASDNVVRAGLTGKPVDVDGLRAWVDPSVRPLIGLKGTDVTATQREWVPPTPEFRLIRHRVTGDAMATFLPGAGPQILLAVRGTLEVAVGGQKATLQAGESLFVEHGRSAIGLRGDGEVFRGAVGHR
ncbi:MAG: mannose-6-phosphate isomerase, class I [Kineosporiaceae bacterium]